MMWSARAVSSAASRPSRFISHTVKRTQQCAACALASRRRRQSSPEALGHHDKSTTRIATAAGAPWKNYAAGDLTR